MNKLENCKVYLAGPVESDDNCSTWRDQITAILSKFNLTIWNPIIHPSWVKNEYNITPELQRGDKKLLYSVINHKLLTTDEGINRLHANQYIRNVCLRLTSACDFIICKIGAPTVGTFEELALAKQQNKPVLFISEEEKIDSCWRVAQFYENGKWFLSIRELIKYLESIDLGYLEVNNLNWIFLKGIWNET